MENGVSSEFSVGGYYRESIVVISELSYLYFEFGWGVKGDLFVGGVLKMHNI